MSAADMFYTGASGIYESKAASDAKTLCAVAL